MSGVPAVIFGEFSDEPEPISGDFFGGFSGKILKVSKPYDLV
jgi:hypothetical protein